MSTDEKFKKKHTHTHTQIDKSICNYGTRIYNSENIAALS